MAERADGADSTRCGVPILDADLERIYNAMGGEFWNAEDVVPELRQVLAADSDEAAGAVIDWWGGWGQWQGYDSATEYAREFRRLAAT